MSVANIPEAGERGLAQAVQLLAAAQMAGSDGQSPVPAADELAAVRRLRNAPAEDLWHRGLLIGLYSRRPEVVDATVKAALDRLERLTDPEAQDSLLTAILDACFLHLLGGGARPDAGGGERRAVQAEQAASRLIAAVARRLRQGGPELEHHRARLLARARQIKHREGWGFLAEAAVGLQKDLAAGDGSDALVAEELDRLRKLDLYTLPHSAETALLAYLDQDHRLPLEKVSQDLWQAYRILIAVQAKERSRRAILRAMDNLIHWLDAAPQTPQAREDVLDEVVRLARLGVSRDQLQPRTARHIEAHLELLPGADHPEDLLRQLITRYDAAEGEDILVRGLELLRRLPLVRVRSDELCRFILAPARRQRSAAVWKALLTLVESLVTGLDDWVSTRETLTPAEEKRLRLLRKLLVQDRQLRDLLYRLATDRDLELSHDPQVDAEARETAWRALLRCLPPERIERQREGLLGHAGLFFFVTLEEAGRAHRRELWEALLERWDDLLGPGRPAEERRRRVRSVAGFFRQTRDYLALREQAGGLGRLLHLAFDDPDGEVRQQTEAALIESGYGLEVERERERRRLLALRDRLTGSNQQIVSYETEIAGLTQEAIGAQTVRVEQGLTVQELLQRREGELTGGWIATAALQVDLQEVRLGVLEAMDRANREMVLLRQLQQRLQQQALQAHEASSAVQNLVSRQEQEEEGLRRLRGEQARAESHLADARRRVADLESRRAHLAGNRPRPPSNTGDPERDQARADDFNRAIQRHEGSLRDVARDIATAGSEIENTSRQIASCGSRISDAQVRLGHLQARIDEMRPRIREIQHRIESLGRDLAARDASLAAIRREIERLEARSRELQSRQSSQARLLRTALDANARQIGETQARLRQAQDLLRDLSLRLNRTGHLRDQQRTESQRLVQAIDSGREQYDRVAQRAIPESRDADVAGHSLREAHERELTDAQQSLVQYTQGIDKAVRPEDRLPVRRRKAGEARQNRRTTGGTNP